MIAREAVFAKDPEAPREERCFFCYGTFAEEEAICQADGQRVYHLGCLEPMMLANQIESLEFQKLDTSVQILQGFRPKYPRPRRDY